MVGDQDPDVAPLEVLHQLADIGDRDRVDPGERLVEQHYRRLGRQRTGDFASPPFAPRQGHRRGGAQVDQAEFVKQLLEPGGARVAIGLGNLEHRKNVLLDRHSAKNRGFLRQIAQAQDRPAIHRQPRNVRPVEVDPAAVGLHQPHHRIETGGLAGAIGAEQPDHFAARHAQRDIVEHGAPVIGLGDRTHLEPAHLSRYRSCLEGLLVIHSGPNRVTGPFWALGNVQSPVRRSGRSRPGRRRPLRGLN